MSHQSNDTILERAAETLDLAHEHAEFWVGTTAGKILDSYIAQVVKYIDNNDLEGLYFYVRLLETALRDSAKEMAIQSEEYFHNYEVY